jgi:diadenosine tetraphosphate (Ap4A) HIT family hydrolase
MLAPMSLQSCLECNFLGSGAEAPPLLRTAHFAVHGKIEIPPVPGWMIVAPLRHVEQVDALGPAEQAELQPLIASVAAALRAATPTARVYVCTWNEMLPHLHIHVIARPPDFPPERRGARLFLEDAPTDETARRAGHDVARAVVERMRASSP